MVFYSSQDSITLNFAPKVVMETNFVDELMGVGKKFSLRMKTVVGVGLMTRRPWRPWRPRIPWIPWDFLASRSREVFVHSRGTR